MASEKLAKEREVESVNELAVTDRANIAASFQNVAIKHIEQRLNRAMDRLEEGNEGIQSLAVVGGVAANKELRSRLEALCAKRKVEWKMFVPPPRLCTDQGSMSAWAAIERLVLGSSDAPENQEVHARFPFQSKD
jgi:N6-L-threonylcarbamoyladenine synthase